MKTPFKEENISSFEELDEKILGIRRRRPNKYIFFRGQSESVWGLTPSLFRQTPKLEEIPKDFLKNCLVKERQSVCEFVKMADAIGYNLPGSYLKLLNIHDKKFEIDFNSWYHITQNEFVELITIAQHHGIATRFLDFTSNPFIALYFAAEDAAKKQMGYVSKDPSSDERFSLWVIDAMYLYLPECRIATVHTPTARNKYLNAQEGLFATYKFGDNHLEIQTEITNFDLKSIAEQDCYEIAKLGNGAKNLWPVVHKFNFDFKQSFDILRKLDARDINLTKIKPNLDNIKFQIDFRNKVNEEWTKIAQEMGYFNKEFFF